VTKKDTERGYLRHHPRRVERVEIEDRPTGEISEFLASLIGLSIVAVLAAVGIAILLLEAFR
jgi:hypothetical protein